jgi:hypothetical protein
MCLAPVNDDAAGLATGGADVNYWTIDVKQFVDSTANAGQWKVKCFGDLVPCHADQQIQCRKGLACAGCRWLVRGVSLAWPMLSGTGIRNE